MSTHPDQRDREPQQSWPRVRMFGCSTCGRLATTQHSHWCGGEWKPSMDTVVSYDPAREKRVA